MDTTVGSLCSGILGLDLAVEAHYGARIAWHSEIEPSVAPVIARHTDSPNLGDLTTIDWHDVEPVDILTAGYPCQPFSNAGPRKGTTDDRHLWPYIADAVRVLRPRLVVLENVRAHLSLGFDAVLGDLADAGFDAEWCVLRASDVGAPHQRARLFVVARNTDRAREDAHATAGAPRKATGERRGDASDAYSVAGPPPLAEHRGPGEVDESRAVKGVERLRGVGAPPDATGAERRGTQQQGMGEAVRRAAEPGERAGAGADGRAVVADPDRSPAGWSGGAVPGEEGRGGDHPERDRPGDGGWPAGGWGPFGPAVSRWERILGRPAPRPTDDVGRLSPHLVEWMMGFPVGWVDELSRTAALKALGNAVVTQQAAAALTVLDPCGAVASYP